MVPRERHTLFAADPLAQPLKEVDCDVTASSLWFSLQCYCTRKFQARERRAASGEAVRPDKRGRKPYKRVRSPRIFSSRPN